MSVCTKIVLEHLRCTTEGATTQEFSVRGISRYFAAISHFFVIISHVGIRLNTQVIFPSSTGGFVESAERGVDVKRHRTRIYLRKPYLVYAM